MRKKLLSPRRYATVNGAWWWNTSALKATFGSRYEWWMAERFTVVRLHRRSKSDGRPVWCRWKRQGIGSTLTQPWPSVSGPPRRTGAGVAVRRLSAPDSGIDWQKDGRTNSHQSPTDGKDKSTRPRTTSRSKTRPRQPHCHSAIICNFLCLIGVLREPIHQAHDKQIDMPTDRACRPNRARQLQPRDYFLSAVTRQPTHAALSPPRGVYILTISRTTAQRLNRRRTTLYPGHAEDNFPNNANSALSKPNSIT